MMSRKQKLPLLPGYVIDINRATQQHFRKSHHFMVHNDTRMLSDIARPSTEGILRVQEGQVPAGPKNHWLLYDKQVLKFYSTFKDGDSIKKCIVYYYLEDDTMQVVEPKVDNSGCYQGTLMHRHRIPLPAVWDKHRSNATNISTSAAQGSGYISISQLNVGKTVEMYGRHFHLVGCDCFTRLFLQKLGAYVPENIGIFHEREEVAANVQELQSTKHARTGVPSQLQFLQLDGLVLRFWGFWDDRKSPDGRLHPIVLLYFLADDTVEVRFENGPLLVKKGRLLKSGPVVTLGAPDQTPVLNVLRGQFLLDSSPAPGASLPCEWVRDSDLAIGATVDVFGRQIVLINCDPFTQQFYRTKYGIEEFIPLPMPPDDDSEYPKQAPIVPLPPYNGFGSFEDSAANCKSVIPVPPQKNFTQFLLKDRQGMDSHVLRFSAQLRDHGNDPRVFIISLFLSDDTVSIHEKFIPNTGFSGGRFLERCRLIKPNQDVFKTPEPLFYGPEDFFVGAQIIANEFVFDLIGADEYALSYMENHCNEYPKSNTALVINKVRAALQSNYKDVVARMLEYDPENSGYISTYKLRETLKMPLSENVLSEQEFQTIVRHFAAPLLQPPDLNLRVKVHAELRKRLFKDMDHLRIELRSRDPNRTGFLTRTAAWAVCRSLPVPIRPDILSLVLDRVKSNDNGDIKHEDLINFFDVETLPANLEIQEDGSIQRRQVHYDRVNYLDLIKELRLEETLTNQTS